MRTPIVLLSLLVAIALGSPDLHAGGTGRTSLAIGTLLVGNGTGAVTQLSPGTAGNVATSNGSTFISQAPLVTNFAESTGFVVTLTGSTTTIETVSITAPAAGYLMIQENFNANVPGGSNTLELGIGVDSTAFARIEPLSTNYTGGETPISMSYRASVASGAHTIYAMGYIASGSFTTTADADISVTWTAN